MNAPLAAKEISAEIIAETRTALDGHKVYGAVSSRARLARFMEHHIYSVWDFMSLIKTLQAAIAPTTVPWAPRGDGSVRRFINELVLEEESDETAPGQGEGFSSHFELYCHAMREVGADPEPALRFVKIASTDGIEAALASSLAPEPSRRFTTLTFDFINSGKLHRVAAALALGREHIIPAMFRDFLSDMRIGPDEAPVFHFYLNRHIHLDEDFHAPLSLKLLNALCDNDPAKFAEAETAAREAVAARIAFWDGVSEALDSVEG
ncbi:MAG: heme oxygenase [Hyphomicrobiales bacterium]|nr:MAG: heme oxygenase [Hyphomicrobiales bacterium]